LAHPLKKQSSDSNVGASTPWKGLGVATDADQPRLWRSCAKDLSPESGHQPRIAQPEGHPHRGTMSVLGNGQEFRRPVELAAPRPFVSLEEVWQRFGLIGVKSLGLQEIHGGKGACEVGRFAHGRQIANRHSRPR
jgi:hypothetical protein